jgi:GTPase SAR1 family protein
MAFSTTEENPYVIAASSILRHPCSVLICGASSSGKTTLIRGILEDSARLTGTCNGFNCVIIVYKCHQTVYSEIKHSLEKKGILVLLFENNLSEGGESEASALYSLIQSRHCRGKNTIIIFDDGCQNERFLSDVFTKYRHHWNISVLVVCHNLFGDRQASGELMRNLNRNATHIILMKMVRDKSMLRSLIYQHQPDKRKARQLLDAIEQETQAPFSHFLLDLK